MNFSLYRRLRNWKSSFFIIFGVGFVRYLSSYMLATDLLAYVMLEGNDEQCKMAEE